MIAKKLKFLLNPPILSLLLSGIGLVALELASRVSAWGTFAWLCYVVYLYVTQVRGRGKMGISFALFSFISLWVIQDINEGALLFATAICIAILLALFLGAIGYTFSRYDAALQLFYYITIGMNVAWWATSAFSGFSFFSTMLVWGGIYLLFRDRKRFLTQVWDTDDSVIYLLFTLLMLQYVWGVALLSMHELDMAALFLIFVVIGDDVISVARTGVITREYIYKNIGLYIGCSIAVLALSFWF